jgi:hypothetical protein
MAKPLRKMAMSAADADGLARKIKAATMPSL